jgi:hypothetical protein
LARIGSAGKRNRTTKAQITVIAPATRYIYCQGLNVPPEICPRP